MKKMLSWLALLAILGFAASALAQSVGAVRGGSRDRAPVLDAKSFNPQKYEGRVLLIAFWQAADEQSDALVPWLSHLQEYYGQDGLSVVAVNIDKNSSAAADAVGTMNPLVQVVLDPTARLVARYQVTTIPGGILYDRAGGERSSFAGFVSGQSDTLTADIELLLKEKPE